MKTNDDIILKVAELDVIIQDAKTLNLTEAQDLALNFALRLTSTSRAIVLLISSGAANEAFTIRRLQLEHFFNVNALLHSEEHRNLLQDHSTGELSRQFKKIIQENEKVPTLTSDNHQKITEFLNHPDRENDPKSGLNWEQISRLGDTAGLYTTYKIYSYIYAHSTLMSLLKNISEEDINVLRRDVIAVLELVRLQLREKLFAATNHTDK